MDLDRRVRTLVSSGDADAAASAAIEALGPGIVGYLRILHRDDDDAEDVFQLWAEDLWRGLAGFRGDCALRARAYQARARVGRGGRWIPRE